MIKNYLTIALRSIHRHKGYSAINIIGLAVGMAACILIMLWVHDELSYDRFHKNIDFLYRVETDQKAGDRWFHVAVTPPPLGPALKEEIPEIADVTRFNRVRYGQEVLLRYGDTAFYQRGLASVDPSFLRMFSFPLIKGDADRALIDPHSIVITQETATKLFGNADPIGKVLNMENSLNLTVTGVIDSVPRNSEIRFTMLVPIELLRQTGEVNGQWNTNSLITAVQLRPNSSVAAINEKITRLVYKHAPEDSTNPDKDYVPPKGQRSEYMLVSIKDVHLHSYSGFETGSNATQRIWIVGALALFILLIACINFMNLATARSARRAKEIGLRKIMGGYRGQIAGQFYGESVIYAVLGMACALLIVEALLPAFNQMTDKRLSLHILGNTFIMIGLPTIVLLTGAVAGSYPALVLSGLRPVRTLARSSSWSGKGALLRRILVVVQFSLSILIIVVTLAVMRQTSYMKTAPVGYDNDQILCLQIPDAVKSDFASFRADLLSKRQILGVAGSAQPPTDIGHTTGSFVWDGKRPEDDIPVSIDAVDYDYVETMGIQLKEGRSFADHRIADSGSALLINEELASLMGQKSAVGARLFSKNRGDHVIGVIKNFHFQPMDTKIDPLVLILRPDMIRYALIKLQAGDIASSVDLVRSTWTRVFPQYPFQLRFLDQDFEGMYRKEERLGNMLTYASLLAILVACLGLYGLAAFLAEQKTKEIGVRKTLGASAANIVKLLSREFLLLVAIAFVLAVPIAWYAVTRWLENFAYRVELGWLTYFSAGALAALVAAITVGYHALKAARTNPVDSLKYE